MARLHEYQGKALLAGAGIAVPEGEAVSSPSAAADAARRLGGRVALKAQAWVTGRAGRGGIAFADTPQEAEERARPLFHLELGGFPVTEVLVEQALDIDTELFASVAIDDEAKSPVLLLEVGAGGSGIEQRAAGVRRLAIDVHRGLDPGAVRAVLDASALDPRRRQDAAIALERLAGLARRVEARTLEVNPLVVTRDGRIVAADCRLTVDDYAVFRHPELGIEIARELDHPATDLERSAWRVEEADHRGTFFFAQLATEAAEGSRGLVGFHGAGGGGSMMSMDAITRLGFSLADFCDTSGNPSASKVYRAARIILAQRGLAGYFGSGSGVASQEQYHSAYGLAKAFCELELSVPAVIRLGGNAEDRAVTVLEDACRDLPGRVEGYRKDDTPAFVAERFAALVEAAGGRRWTPRPRRVPEFAGRSFSFPIDRGTVWIDHDRCDAAATALVVEHGQGLLADEGGRPVPAVGEGELARRDSELVALEIECRRAGRPVVFVDLPVPGLDEAG